MVKEWFYIIPPEGETIEKGGPGSGNWGHAGRPGKVGGSMPHSRAMSIRTGRDWKKRWAAARKKDKTGKGQLKDEDFRINIHLKSSKFVRGYRPSASEPLVARDARKTGGKKRGVDITVDGKAAPGWAKEYAKKRVAAGDSPSHIATTLAAAIDLDKHGRKMTSKYGGKDILTGERISRGEDIIYSKNSGIARPKSLKAVVG